MKLLVFVLNKVSLLDKFLHNLLEKQIKGATIIESEGMARKLIEHEDFDLFGSLRVLLDKPREDSRVIFIVLEEEKVKDVLDVIDKLIDLEEPNSGIVFTLPLDYVKGYNKKVGK